jgi:hypothetical protein
MTLDNLKRFCAILLLPACLALSAGCEKSTAEKVEDGVANATDAVGDLAADAVDAAGDELDNAADAVGDAARDLKNKLD